ncbi:MAG: hypothetical protein ABF991_09285 [Liquorilactobacillus hordei]|uniref:Uncharacterized protein n=2 Tax=Liquorilactobacillus hordei TaxID=468911 RepID=A0A0R1MXV7_9LACO|nr:hypothetical protein [Liquorilactobacillus hordei]AUJ29951.1 hypothetical protein BSQ49_06925 [Liquorilactobacillus hordei]KRL08344.1 hypothetical protein FC92_GL000135 [Liquorilactobacillus hordei DSM 19519]MBZ2404789.1 hypothetical protein [Liquorilactobacillus hordei]QYH52557.1 hypothetical protein G6O70_09015 [Liquorilactobacillus hordei DSM 19519]
MYAKDRGTKKILIIGIIILLIASASGGIGYYFGTQKAQSNTQIGSTPNGKKMKGMPNGKKPSAKSFKN